MFGSEDVLKRMFFSKVLKLKRANSGFTLVESLVALGILTMTLGVIGGGILQSLSIERFWLDDVTATREARHSGSWLSGDVLNAEEVCDAGAELAANATSTDVTLFWYDVADPDNLPGVLCQDIASMNYTMYKVTYSKSGSNLLRTKTTVAKIPAPPAPLVPDLVEQITLSQKVSGVTFSRSGAGDVLTMTLDVNAERNTTETLTLDTFLRRLR